MEKRYYRLMFDEGKNLISCIRIAPPPERDFFTDNYGRIVYQDIYLYIRTDDSSLYYEIVLSADSSEEAIDKASQFVSKYVNNSFQNQQNCCGDKSSETCCCDDERDCDEEDDEDDEDEELFTPSIKCDRCDVDVEEIKFCRDLDSLITDDVKLRHVVGTYLIGNLLKNVRVIRNMFCIEDVYTITSEFHSFDVDLFYDFLTELVAYHDNPPTCCDCCGCESGDESC